MALFPRFGRGSPNQVLIKRPQVQEEFLKDAVSRIANFQMKELGSLNERRPRGVPETSYLRGAVFENETVDRDEQSIPFTSDKST